MNQQQQLLNGLFNAFSSAMINTINQNQEK